MEHKSKITILSILIALVALILLVSSIAIVDVSQKKKASVDNLIDPLGVLDNGSSEFVPTSIQVFDGTNSDSNDDNNDDVAPASITNLTSVEIGQNHLYWNWTNPTDSDFYRNRIYINGIYQVSTSNNFYNATGLASNTTYTITIHTMDDSSNVNTTDVNDTQTTLLGSGSPNSTVITPVIPDIAFDEDGSNNSILLDNYVTDPDTALVNLTWTFSGNASIMVNIDPLDSNRLTLSAPADWNGAEIITIRVDDLDGNWDDQAVIVTVNSIDDVAVWNILSNQAIDEDSAIGSIVYSDIASECTDVDTALTISASPNTEFTLGFDGTNLTLDSLTADWNGIETVTVNCNGIPTTFDLTVNPIDDPSVWNTLSDQVILQDSPAGTIVYPNLMSECTDVDSIVDISSMSVPFNTEFILWFTGNDLTLTSLTAGWTGTETVTVNCNGIAGNFDLTVVANTAPKLTSALPDQTLDEDTNLDDAFNLESYFDDAEDSSAGLTYTVVLQTNNSIVDATIDGTNNIDLNTLANMYGTNDVTIRATDTGGLWVEDTFTITVNPINDNPTLTTALPDQTLDEDTNLDDAFNLENYFDDVEDGSAGLTYTVVLQTNNSIVDATIDGTNNLDLNTLANMFGTSDVTIRATDVEGLWVEDTFTITVNWLQDDYHQVCGAHVGEEWYD